MFLKTPSTSHSYTLNFYQKSVLQTFPFELSVQDCIGKSLLDIVSANICFQINLNRECALLYHIIKMF